MRSAYRLTGLGHWIGEEQTTGHATIWNKATKNCPVLLMLQDSVEPTICPSPKLGIQIPSRDDWDNINNTICQNGIIWFTDGSKIGDKAGEGVYGKTTRTQLSFALGSYASVFQAEIYAILACGMEILKTAPRRRTIQICTDSQAALMAIESSKVKSRLVLDCKKILNDLASCNGVILTWVPGHSGVPGNEEADRLARLGSIGYPIGPEPILGVPYLMGVSTMKELLNKEFEKSWQEAPELLSIGQTKLGHGKPVLQKSVLGWLISGPIPVYPIYSNLVTKPQYNLATVDISKQLEQFWLIEEIPQQKMYSSEESECEREFINNVQRDKITGRFTVTLPLKDNYKKLGDSLTMSDN
ncbi:hypothetical protein NQ318_020648 [Aromia moschata]|uniref:RNase H type-1 domain-containing protein n=1 Tax=Aromia moschata TaxID=1265417 RepID=A0AAV8XE31_9CUCU|nr:hypothetical protein NQ318_020648 [Aromia moschata]